MKLFFTVISCCSFLFACNSNTASDTSKADTVANRAPVNLTARNACFQLIVKQDTFDINYTRSGDSINGTMRFNPFEKDKSIGTIQGTFSGDTLKLFYNFRSEGTSSVRQIYLKQEDDELITATGDEYTKADSALLKDPSKIRFDGMVYKKTDCAKE